ncbi:MAG: hypothetical protein K1W34_01625 [Lachnospiraceae bacterium]
MEHILNIRQKGSDNLRKPTYYIWRDNYSTQEEYEITKEHYIKMGFRVVTFKDGRNDYDIQKGIRAVIKNHIIDSYD